MANKIKITTAELRTQADKMDALNERLDGVITQMNGALKKIDDSTCAKFSSNIIVKTASLRRNMQNARNYLLIGAGIARKCAESYTNADTVIRKNIADINTPEVQNAVPSTQTVSGSYREKVDYINSQDVPTQHQIYRLDNNHNKETGVCNISSITTLLNRKLALEGKSDENFTVQDAFRANGCTVKESGVTWYSGGNSKGATGYVYNGGTGNWGSKNYSNADGTSYQAVSESKSAIDSNMRALGITNYNQYLVKMLEEHPEGICLRNDRANHVAVITSYEIIDGKIQFYVQDPVNSYSGKLEGSWLYRNNSTHDIFNGLDFITYLK